MVMTPAERPLQGKTRHEGARSRRERRRRAEARPRLMLLRDAQLLASHRGGPVLAEAVSAPKLQSASLEAVLPRVDALEAVVSALQQQADLTAEICKSAAHEAVKAHMDQHDAVLPRVDALEAVVSALKQQADLTAEICKSAAHEVLKTPMDQHDAVLYRVDALEAVVDLTPEICSSAAQEAPSVVELGPPLPYQSLR